MEVSANPSNYAAATEPQLDDNSHAYVEVDTRFYNDCRHLPSSAKVNLAIRRTFEEDDDRRILPQGKYVAGKWRIETNNLDKYKSTDVLALDGIDIGRITIKRERVTITESGYIQRRQVRDPNDLLITMRFADSFPLSKISDEKLIAAILDLGVGTIKRAPQRQLNKDKTGYTGHKYFILANVTKADRERIPNEFTFNHPSFGNLKMHLSHFHQIRHCNFCGRSHEAVCPVKQLVEEMKKQRDPNPSVHICGDSTLRYTNEVALNSGVDAMSGGTTGNLLNSLDVVDDLESKKDVIFVTGSNDQKPNLSPEEFIFSLKTIRERVLDLLQHHSKRIAIVPPPKKLEYISAEQQVRNEVFNDHLQLLKDNGVALWDNPLGSYEEDDGAHPSQKQTVTLMKFIAKKVADDFGGALLLPTATDEVIALPNRYNHCTSLYKYGCGACPSKARNEWFNLCDICKKNATSDEYVTEKVKWFTARLNQLAPLVGYESDEYDDLRCEECDVVFHDIKELRTHFSDTHPNSEPKYKRKVQNEDRKGSADDAKKNRRDQHKGTPYRSLDK